MSVVVVVSRAKSAVLHAAQIKNQEVENLHAGTASRSRSRSHIEVSFLFPNLFPFAEARANLSSL